MSIAPKGYRGFTLLELSVVLTIIGLIVGGVLVGRDLIHSATLRAEISNLTRFETAVRAFQGKYNALPGDMANADTMIPGVTIGHNGNGNGVIDPNYSAIWGAEYVYVWEHLSKAGLIAGKYDASGWTADGTCALTTCPQSKINSNDIFYMGGAYDWDGPLYGNSLTNTNDTIEVLWLGSANWNVAQMSVADVQELDTKLDDGVAATGRLLTINDNWTSGNCVTGDVTVTNGSAVYNMTDTAKDCQPIYIFH